MVRNANRNRTIATKQHPKKGNMRKARSDWYSERARGKGIRLYPRIIPNKKTKFKNAG